MKRFLLLLLFLPIFAFAGIGKITVLKGDVTIKRSGDVIKAKAGTELEKKDFISTDKNGKVQIVFSDKTIFTIGKNSTLDIADYLYDEAKPKRNKAKFNVLKGAFSSITGKIGKLNKSKFKLKTKSASIGIRGTIVKANQEIIMCTEGAITVATADGIAVRLEAGQKTALVNGVPSAPVAIQPGDEDALGVDVVYDDNEGIDITNDEDSSFTVTVIDPKEPDIDEKEIEEKTLTGRTIDKTGATEAITIKGTKVDGVFTMDKSTGLQMTDIDGKDIDSIKDTTITWGHWADDPTKVWVAGEATDVKVLDEMRSKSVNAEYTGKVMGSVNKIDGTGSADHIKMDSTNNLQMNFKFGDSGNNMNGNLQFQTQSGQDWKAKFDGTTSGNSFSSTGFDAAQSSGAGKGLTQGGIDGNFYGQDAEKIGGTGHLTNDTDRATFGFQGSKQ